MKLLLTNDDGIDAAGLDALARAASPLGEVLCIAPHAHLSGCSHRVTTDQPLHLQPRRDRHFALDGTPADCVRVGLGHLVPDADWVLSGINHGGNLGADVHHSGTVAAVREAALHGKPGIALSHYHRKGQTLDWDRAVAWIRPILRQWITRPFEPGVFWNINLPHLGPDEPDPKVIFCPLEAGPLPLSFRLEGDRLHYNGNYHGRVRKPGSDVDVCFRGDIAVTELRLAS